MKKITVYLEGGGITLDLQDPLILSHGSELYVKTAAVFWNYKNIRKGFNYYIYVDGKKIMIDEGYWTFKQLRKELEENGLTLKEYPDGRIRIDFLLREQIPQDSKISRVFWDTGPPMVLHTPHTSAIAQ